MPRTSLRREACGGDVAEQALGVGAAVDQQRLAVAAVEQVGQRVVVRGQAGAADEPQASRQQ